MYNKMKTTNVFRMAGLAVLAAMTLTWTGCKEDTPTPRQVCIPEMFVKNHEVARLAEPEKKRVRKWLVVFWAAIFWISTLFVIGHPFCLGCSIQFIFSLHILFYLTVCGTTRYQYCHIRNVLYFIIKNHLYISCFM